MKRGLISGQYHPCLFGCGQNEMIRRFASIANLHKPSSWWTRTWTKLNCERWRKKGQFSPQLFVPSFISIFLFPFICMSRLNQHFHSTDQVYKIHQQALFGVQACPCGNFALPEIIFIFMPSGFSSVTNSHGADVRYCRFIDSLPALIDV